MSPAEVREFLATQRTLILSTLRRDGAPVSHALWFTYLDDAVYLDTQSASFKARNIRRDPRVCCLVEAGETYFELRGVMIQGRCAAVDEPDEIRRVEAAAAEKSARIGSGIEELPRWFGENRQGRRTRGSRVMFKVPLEKVTTWNFGQAREHYRRAADSERIDAASDLDRREAEVLGKPERIAPLAPEEFDEEAKALVAGIRASLGRSGPSALPAVFGTMLKHPGLFRRHIEMGTELLGRGALEPRERELAILRVAWLCRAPYEWGEHVEIAKRCGLTGEQIERVTLGSTAPGWTEHETAILRGVEELLRDQMISDETWDVLARKWTERQRIEFPMLVGQYVATAYSQNSLRIRLEAHNRGLRHR